jgi:mRNA-degrading endonuclease RelE of RelBE toxin-antitoxin system
VKLEIKCHSDIDKDLKNLKKCADPLGSLESWERLFLVKGIKETTGIDPYPGFGGNNIYKARVIPLKEKCGKSGGYRLIFQVISEGEILLLVYYRHSAGKLKKESDVVKEIKSRLKE